MKKTSKLLAIGTSLVIAGFLTLDLLTEKILPASLFIIGAGYFIESVRLMILPSK